MTRENESNFQILFENSPDAIFVEDEAGNILAANPAACRLHEMPSEELVGANVAKIVPPDRPDAMTGGFMDLIEGRIEFFESVSATSGGRRIPVELRACRIAYQGKPAFLINVRDITARKKAEDAIRTLNAELEHRVEERTAELAAANEKLARANAELEGLDRLKTAFIHLTSHELRNPLTIILGMLEILERQYSARDAQLGRALNLAVTSARRLAKIVDRTIEFSQLGEFDRTLDRRAIDPAELARRVFDDVAPFARMRKLTFEAEAPAGLPAIEASPEAIRDVIANLLMNAVKFTPDGGVVRLAVQPAGEEAIEFVVTDTGIGISEEDKPHVFREFFASFDMMRHSSGEYEFKKRGIGLGLAVVKRLVEMHGGTIAFESAEGQGTTFRLTLPVQQA